MFNSTFKIIYLILFAVVLTVRKIYTSRNRKMDFIVSEKSTGDLIFLSLNGIGMIIPLIYVFSSWLDFADYALPHWIGWLGAIAFATAIWLLYLSHRDLGKNWTPVMAIQKEHTLVTTGIYKYIRHPMYAAHLLWALAQVLMLHNWIAGYSFIVVMLPHYFMRVGKEETMMTEQFGAAYKEYMKRSGRITPRIS